MTACQYPVSGSREKGTLLRCGNPATHYFDFTPKHEEGHTPSYVTSHLVVCPECAKDPQNKYPGKTAIRIGAKS